MKIKALTVHQPWATLLAHEEKRFETRSWKPAARLQRGEPLALHAGQTYRREALEITAIRRALRRVRRAGGRVWLRNGDVELPTGRVLAVMTVRYVVDAQMVVNEINPRERVMGDWSNGQYGWRMRRIHLFENPPEARGQQGVWTWEPEEEVLP